MDAEDFECPLCLGKFLDGSIVLSTDEYPNLNFCKVLNPMDSIFFIRLLDVV